MDRRGGVSPPISDEGTSNSRTCTGRPQGVPLQCCCFFHFDETHSRDPRGTTTPPLFIEGSARRAEEFKSTAVLCKCHFSNLLLFARQYLCCQPLMNSPMTKTAYLSFRTEGRNLFFAFFEMLRSAPALSKPVALIMLPCRNPRGKTLCTYVKHKPKNNYNQKQL